MWDKILWNSYIIIKEKHSKSYILQIFGDDKIFFLRGSRGVLKYFFRDSSELNIVDCIDVLVFNKQK